MADVVEWIRSYQTVFQFLGAVSLLMLVVSLVAFPLVVINLPKDYFVRERRDPAHQIRRHPLVWGVLTVIKNVVGFTLVLAGIAMLVLPGQGVLTILVGLALTNFPGKFTVERRLVARPAVAKALNRIREMAGRPRLEMPEDLED
jgi:hypothetical protein